MPIAVLAPLQHDRPIAIAACISCQTHDLPRAQTIALCPFIFAPQTAVKAVLSANIRELDESAKMHAIAHILSPHTVGSGGKRLFCSRRRQKPGKLLLAQAMLILRLFYQPLSHDPFAPFLWMPV